MMQDGKYAKSLADASIGEFNRQLEYKAEWRGKTVVPVDRFYPSTQICSKCGEQWEGVKDLTSKKWTCPNCGEVLDRNVNAANNILNEGMRLSEQS